MRGKRRDVSFWPILLQRSGLKGMWPNSRVFKAKARPSFCASPCEQPHALEGLTQQTETGRGPAEQMPSMGCSIKWNN